MDIKRAPNGATEVMTHRSGKFVFQPGIDMEKLQPMLDRVLDAHKRFIKISIVPEAVSELESIHGTDTIEGGNLSEDDREQRDLRIANLKKAYDFVDNLSENFMQQSEGEEIEPVFQLEESSIKEIHRIITDRLVMSNNVPGHYRNNPKGSATRVRNLEHGGDYVPPKCLADVAALMEEFVLWANSSYIRSLDPLIRAPLIHYYFKSIHPFEGGNGRVGRLLEALVLKCSGFGYAPYTLSKLYQENMDEYFSVFNATHRLAEKKDSAPNNEYVLFFLEKLLSELDYLHDTARRFMDYLLIESHIDRLLKSGEINDRQHILMNILLRENLQAKFDLKNIKLSPLFQNLYRNSSQHTVQRDLIHLQNLGLIEIGKDNSIKVSGIEVRDY